MHELGGRRAVVSPSCSSTAPLVPESKPFPTAAATGEFEAEEAAALALAFGSDDDDEDAAPRRWTKEWVR